MIPSQEYTCELSIENPLGFHVRPVQRFVELAQAFKADITVEIEGREASGKSVMALMSLGGRHGATMRIKTRGEDARQALDVVCFLVQENFFVEDDIEPEEAPRRHIDRLKRFVSFFESSVKIIINGDEEVDVKSSSVFDALDFSPDADIDFVVEGRDEEQALEVLNKLVDYKFFVEDAMNTTYE